MKTIMLNGAWKLAGKPQMADCSPISLCAQVPGCVQLDLSAAGYLPQDLFLGENIKATKAYEDWEWWYERCFQAPPERENVFLVFEGADCMAEYFLNGVRIGKSENMFISHTFQVDEYLQNGENILTVHITSPIIAAHNEACSLKRLYTTTHTNAAPIRKAPHSYGWDIMPRVITAGLWRDVKLEVRDSIYFEQLFIRTRDTHCDCLYEMRSDWREFQDVEIEVFGACDFDSNFHKRIRCNHKAGIFSFDVENPKKWFPTGYGEANVYDGTARIYRQGQLVHEEQFSFGIRDVVLERTDITDGINGQFRFLINGIEVMCKGTNWVPLDAFHSRDAGRYASALELMKDIGCNIVRCWGGNVYEDHVFFDFCDRNGIMVWQDFAMACNIYPEDGGFKQNLEQEATAVVRKLRQHPSLILWSGDNEVDEVYVAFGINPDTNSITRELLAKVVDLNDIGRPYLPSSPYITQRAYEKSILERPSAFERSETHLWGVRDYYKSAVYRHNKAHFVSECGYHGCPGLASIKKFIIPERVWPYTDNPEWILHSSDQNGNPWRVLLMEKQVRQLFGQVPTEPEDYILASQISQAEAKKYFIERMRIGRPRKTGIIWWNLLDGWPQMSDAVVDYYFEKKLAYHYIKRSQQPFIVAADDLNDWNLYLYACNDTLQKQTGHLAVREAKSGEVLLNCDFCVPENTSIRIGEMPMFYSEQKFLIMEWTANGVPGRNHYLCGNPPFDLDDYQTILRQYDLYES